ncbi:LysE family translocator [Acinetobacter sp. TGL-Y2]|uniref:LysE family translocator n=1 Tax=Acinetobacter sp. TGL-Y2 TaxID=1407071 RepID=UPI000B07F9D6|nr:LysE family translocator [Acinetobacter sp. TGL-Y2]
MFSLIFSMFTFSLSMSISPGPVNITILSSSMNYGLKQTFAFISGATIGFTALLAAVCFGLYQVISLYPILLNLITVLGTALLVGMGWNIARAKGESIQTDQLTLPKAPTFMQGALLQWLNPKAWIAAVSGTALFSASHNVFYLFCLFSFTLWFAIYPY